MAEKKYVIFKLGEEEYGIDIMKVKEVTEYKETVKVPNTPDFVEGIINLRGDVTPIISLKRRFGLNHDTALETTRVIVVNLEDRLIGFIVDDASQVLSLDDNQIDSAPEIVTGIGKKYIEGIGKVENRMIIMLDLLQVLDEDEKKELMDVNN